MSTRATPREAIQDKSRNEPKSIMIDNLRLALTADLHWGIRQAGDDATRLLIDFLRKEPPDVLIVAGDIGAGENFSSCLSLFAD